MEQIIMIIACGGMVAVLWLGMAMFVRAIARINKRGKWKVLRRQVRYEPMEDSICNHLAK